jgi:hypothetical protein
MSHYQRAGKFSIKAVVPYIPTPNNKVPKRRDYPTFSGFDLSVKMTGERMQLFHRTQKCACCFLLGDHFWLEKSGFFSWHFNLYGYNRDSKPIMLTMDHILPKSKGGKTTPDNLQLLCSRCNKIKKNLVISLEDLRKKVVSKENSNAEGQSQS